MKYIIYALFCLLATFFLLKTICYGIFELKQKNAFGGNFIIVFAAIVYIIFLVGILL